MNLLYRAAFVPLLLALPSCMAMRHEHLQRDMREAVLCLMEQQLLDNLVRIHKGLPILHVDYTTLTGSVTHTSTTEAGVTIEPGTDPFTLGTEVEMEDKMQLIAKPVLNNDSVYDAYQDYMKGSTPLMCTKTPPTSGDSIIARKYGANYYWVPTAKKDEFFKLALDTSVKRGATSPARSVAELFQGMAESLEQIRIDEFGR